MTVCTDWQVHDAGRRAQVIEPCTRPPAARLLWDELLYTGARISTSRVYCDHHADLQERLLRRRGVAVRREFLR